MNAISRDEFPDQAGYPDGVGFLDQGTTEVLREVSSWYPSPQVALSDVDFEMQHDSVHKRYMAWVHGEEIADMPYRLVGGRMVLLTTTVHPEFRGKGVATEFISHVLEDVRRTGRKVTNYCPIVRAFIDGHPEYADILDEGRPGVTSDSVRAATEDPSCPLVYEDEEPADQ